MHNRHRGKRRVRNAVLVNSTMRWVLTNANRVRQTRITMTKEETLRALIVPSVGLLKTAVPNVPRALRVRLALGVEIVHWVMPETETTVIRLNVNNVNWVKQRRLQVLLNAMIVMPEDLAKSKEFVRHAQMDSIKTPKAKQNAVIPVSC